MICRNDNNSVWTIPLMQPTLLWKYSVKVDLHVCLCVYVCSCVCVCVCVCYWRLSVQEAGLLHKHRVRTLVKRSSSSENILFAGVPLRFTFLFSLSLSLTHTHTHTHKYTHTFLSSHCEGPAQSMLETQSKVIESHGHTHKANRERERERERESQGRSDNSRLHLHAFFITAFLMQFLKASVSPRTSTIWVFWAGDRISDDLQAPVPRREHLSSHWLHLTLDYRTRANPWTHSSSSGHVVCMAVCVSGSAAGSLRLCRSRSETRSGGRTQKLHREEQQQSETPPDSTRTVQLHLHPPGERRRSLSRV